MKTNRIIPNKGLRIVTCLALAALTLVFSPYLHPRASTAVAQLSIARTNNNNIVITWTNDNSILQFSSSLSSTTVWSDLLLAASPYTFQPTNPQGFYRLQEFTGTQTNFAFRYVPINFTMSIGDPSPSACGCVSPEGPTSSGAKIPGIAEYNGMGAVSLATGEVVQHAVDFEIPGRGFNWRMERHYRSGIEYDGPAGQNWEFNYNQRLFVEPSGSVLRMDGAGRADLYVFITNGVYQAPNGFYTKLTSGGGTFTERDRHGMQYLYSATNSLGIAQLAQIIDRNGNQMTFQYNAGGQLSNVVDTLGRPIQYRYDGSGRLTNVTDFAGRQLQFGYDGNDNLVSVTSPVVTNTPTGNDFPNGKTTRYTYSSGYADERFNHNLLSVTAPNEVAVSGPSRLIAQYNTSPSSSSAGRVLLLTLGGSNLSGVPSGGNISYAYTNLASVATNDFISAVSQDTVIDRNGNTAIYQFNQIGDIVRVVEYTRGLRPTDPASFVTSLQYNKDGETIQVTNAAGDSAQYTFDASNPDRLQQGNLLSALRLPGTRGGDQAQLTTSYTYETNFNFVAIDTDARSNVTRYAYDPNGNCTNIVRRIPTIVDSYTYNTNGQVTAHVLPDNGSGHHRTDVMTYYTSGPQTGYLQQRIVDSGNFNLTTTYEYDNVGNVTRMIDPRSNDTLYAVNQLNQVVQTSSPAVSTTNGLVRYVSSVYYDDNNDVIQTVVQNIDDGGNIVASLPNIATTNVYDILDFLVSTAQTVTTNHSITTEYRYDADNNRTLTISGVATSGQQTNNVVSTLYDERCLVFQVDRAPGDPGHSTTQLDYDGDRNLVRNSQGIESNPRITTYTYDGYNRQIVLTNAMGNVTTTHYDPNGNAVSAEVDGELVDVPGSAGNIRLAETTYTYDDEDRQTVSDVAFFDTVTQTNIGTGQALTTTTYSDNSQVLTNTDANSNVTAMAYDTANRLQVVTDAKTNTITYAYDPDNNVIKTVEVDLSDLGSPSQTFTTTNIYDTVNRLIQTVDNIGNTNSYAYDSRNNRVSSTDARGNVTHHAYDGMNRPYMMEEYLTSNGLGNGAVIGSIVTLQSFDDNSRLTNQTDANTNSTTYAYDALNRKIETLFADGTTNSSAYDVHDNVTTATDANGTVVNDTFDLLNRISTRTVTPGPGVSGTTFENYEYDGLSRVVLAGNDASTVTRGYDSLSDLTRDTQLVLSGGTTQTVVSAYDAMRNRSSLTYPSGRVINTTYDALNRQKTISDSSTMAGTIATYSYFGGKWSCPQSLVGASRVERRDYGNGTRAAYLYDAEPRYTNIVQSVIASGTNIDDRAYAWDAANNQTAMTDLLAPNADARSFSYDSVNQLTQSVTAVAGPTVSYQLDGVGNRLSVTGGTNAGVYSLSASVPPADFQMNQYTATPFDTRTYDANGNLTNAGPQQFVYDYRNELVTYTAPPSNPTPVSMSYDCFGRRLQKASAGTTNRYYYIGWQEIEQEEKNNGTQQTYVWGVHIDDLLSMDHSGQRYFFHADDLGSIRKVTDTNANVVEQYHYGDYGEPSFFDGSGAPLASTQITNNTLFTGRRFDPETGLYYYRTRYLDPVAGRFISRDTIGIWGDRAALGNGFTYVGNNPLSAIDPTGECHWWDVLCWGCRGVCEANYGVTYAACYAQTAAGYVACDLAYAARIVGCQAVLWGRLIAIENAYQAKKFYCFINFWNPPWYCYDDILGKMVAQQKAQANSLYRDCVNNAGLALAQCKQNVPSVASCQRNALQTRNSCYTWCDNHL